MVNRLLIILAALVLVGAEAYFYVAHPAIFTFLLPLVAIGIVSVIYFRNNPVGHGRAFRIRSYLNWLPLGLTYASLYWGRYNLTKAKSAFGDVVMSKEEFGTIFAIGAIVYGVSFLINGPLTDRLGGKKTIIIAAAGSSVCNAVLGWFTYAALSDSTGETKLFLPFVLIYALNMYFQSFGAVSIVKVNAAWFHIRERGVFGGSSEPSSRSASSWPSTSQVAF